VALNAEGNIALIGVRGDDSFRGSAYFFTRCGTGWIESQKILASDGVPFDNFGWSVALNADGGYGLVGTPFNDDPSNSGSAYLFTRCGTGWIESQKILASDGADNDRFGSSVALNADGGYGLVGAYQKNSSRGEAYILDLYAPGTLSSGDITVPWKHLATQDLKVPYYLETFSQTTLINTDGNTGLFLKFDTNGEGASLIWSETNQTWYVQKLLGAEVENVLENY